jgi:hypothetical protein
VAEDPVLVPEDGRRRQAAAGDLHLPEVNWYSLICLTIHVRSEIILFLTVINSS